MSFRGDVSPDPLPGSADGNTFDARPRQQAAEEERIVKTALAELPPGRTVLLEGDDLALGIASHLPADQGHTVVTTAPRTALALSRRTDIDLYCVGGRYDNRVGGDLIQPIGAWERIFAEIRVDVAFIGAEGVSAQRGLTVGTHAGSSVKKAATGIAAKTVVLADHTRLGHSSTFRFARLSEVDCLITDSGAAPEQLRELRTRVERLVVA
ncbi:DeoR/GlpR family DNA-binding transcription regulator [Nocardiopsis protaetiae]|uniref:DeoR/GlpR family DNA-binding transcription regulator n=1 Tax=Nocardiopsis protaetiae TaxID=3382270 RepID=UPI00387AA023